MKRVTSKSSPRWRVTRIAGSASKFVGLVWGPETREEALKQAVEQFEIKSVDQQRRLVAMRDN